MSIKMIQRIWKSYQFCIDLDTADFVKHAVDVYFKVQVMDIHRSMTLDDSIIMLDANLT